MINDYLKEAFSRVKERKNNDSIFELIKYISFRRYLDLQDRGHNFDYYLKYDSFFSDMGFDIHKAKTIIVFDVPKSITELLPHYNHQQEAKLLVLAVFDKVRPYDLIVHKNILYKCLLKYIDKMKIGTELTRYNPYYYMINPVNWIVTMKQHFSEIQSWRCYIKTEENTWQEFTDLQKR